MLNLNLADNILYNYEKLFKEYDAIFFDSNFYAWLLQKVEDDEPNADNRKITYEITGNFTGKLMVIYNDNVNGNTIISNVSLPWTKEVAYADHIQAIGIGGSSKYIIFPNENLQDHSSRNNG